MPVIETLGLIANSIQAAAAAIQLVGNVLTAGRSVIVEIDNNTSVSFDRFADHHESGGFATLPPLRILPQTAVVFGSQSKGGGRRDGHGGKHHLYRRRSEYACWVEQCLFGGQQDERRAGQFRLERSKCEPIPRHPSDRRWEFRCPDAVHDLPPPAILFQRGCEGKGSSLERPRRSQQQRVCPSFSRGHQHERYPTQLHGDRCDVMEDFSGSVGASKLARCRVNYSIPDSSV